MCQTAPTSLGHAAISCHHRSGLYKQHLPAVHADLGAELQADLLVPGSCLSDCSQLLNDKSAISSDSTMPTNPVSLITWPDNTCMQARN